MNYNTRSDPGNLEASGDTLACQRPPSASQARAQPAWSTWVTNYKRRAAQSPRGADGLYPTAFTHLPEQPKEHISVEGALMGLVHDDGTVVIQVRFPERLPEQDPVRHVFDQSVF